MVKIMKKIILFYMILFIDMAYANCDVIFTDIHEVEWEGNGKHIGYDVFENKKGIQVLEFQITRTDGTSPCQIAIGASSLYGNPISRELKYGDKKLEYDLYLDRDLKNKWLPYINKKSFSMANLAIVTFGARINNPEDVDLQIDEDNLTERQEQNLKNRITRRGVKVPLNSANFKIYFSIPAKQIVSPGNYLDNIILTAYEIEETGFIPKDIQKLRISTKVKEKLDLTIGKEQGFIENGPKKYSINFGTLDFGEEVIDNFFLNVRSNTKFKYKLQSANKGKLLLDSGFDQSLGLKKEFPFLMLINGSKHDFVNSKEYTINAWAPNGIAIPMAVKINGDIDLENYHPGIYKDSVAVIVAPDN